MHITSRSNRSRWSLGQPKRCALLPAPVRSVMRLRSALLVIPVLIFCGHLVAQDRVCHWNNEIEQQVFSMIPDIISRDDVLKLWEFELPSNPKAYYISSARGVCALGVKDGNRENMMLVVYYEPSSMTYVDHVGMITQK